MKKTTEKGALPMWFMMLIIFFIIYDLFGFKVMKISVIVSLVGGFIFVVYMFWEKGFFDEYLK